MIPRIAWKTGAFSATYLLAGALTYVLGLGQSSYSSQWLMNVQEDLEERGPMQMQTSTLLTWTRRIEGLLGEQGDGKKRA